MNNRFEVVRKMCAIVLLGTLASPVYAQQSAPTKPKQESQPAATFRARSELVLVPTTVEKGGRPVLGLTKENFVIEEDGRERPIGIFDAVTTKNLLRVDPPKRGSEFDNLNSDQTPRSMMLIAIDAINTPFGYQEAVRKDVLKYMAKNVSPNQLTGLVVLSAKGVRLIHDFTGSTESLIAALQKVSGENNRYNGVQDVARSETRTTNISSIMDNRGEPTIGNTGGGSPAVEANADQTTDPGTKMMNTIAKQLNDYLKGEDKVQEYQAKSRIRSTLEAFQQIAQGLAGYPGRKSLIWASASFPAPLDPNRYNDMELMTVYERTLKLLADANVAVYPVDVKGLQIVSPGADATISQYDRLANKDTGANYKEASLKINTFNEFAERTGGRAWFDINNNDKAIKEAMEDSQAYYMLGYYVDASNTKEGWHKLRVKLKGADGKVRTRSGYFFSAAALDPETSRKNDLMVGVRSPFDYTTLKLRGEIVGVSGDGPKKKLEFALQVLPSNNIVGQGGDAAINLDFVAIARKPDTEVAGQSARQVSTTLKPESVAEIEKNGISYKNAMELEPGTYDIRFLVRDNLTGRMGSALTTVTVK